jgi:hypothetical protein
MKGNQSYSTKSVDLARAKALLMEGNMTPLRSRLKDLFREHITQSESGSSKETNSGRRKAAIESVVGHGINNLSSHTATFTLEECPCYSSDDEESEMTSSSSSASMKPKRMYSPYSSLQMAPPLDHLWPPKQTIPKSPFRAYNPSYRHIFLTIPTREENPNSSSSSSSTPTTTTPTAGHDPVAIMNEALKKKRKISEGGGDGNTTGTQGNLNRGVEAAAAAPRPKPATLAQPVIKMMPPRAVPQLTRPTYPFPPRPHTFPPGTIVRGGVLHTPPGQPRPLLAYHARPGSQHGQIPRIPPPPTVAGLSDVTSPSESPSKTPSAEGPPN